MQGEAWKDKIALGKTLRSVILLGVRLCTVLPIFDFRNIFETFSKYHLIDPKSPGNWSFWNQIKLFDSAQYHTARSVRLFLDFRSFEFPDNAQCDTEQSPTLRSVILRTVRRVRLSAVWYRAESDSAQCDTAQSPTPRSITLRRVTFFANIFAKTNFSAKPF